MLLGILNELAEVTIHTSLDTEEFKDLCSVIDDFLKMSEEDKQFALAMIDSKKIDAIKIIDGFFEKHYSKVNDAIIRNIETIRNLLENHAKAQLVTSVQDKGKAPKKKKEKKKPQISTAIIPQKQKHQASKTATFFFMYHEEEKRLAGVQRNGHLAVKLEEIDANGIYKYKYISFYPKKDENLPKPNKPNESSANTSKRHARTFSTKQAILKKYEEEQFNPYFKNALTVRFDCTERHSLNFERMWAMGEAIEKDVNAEDESFNILRHNCTDIVLDIFNAGQENNQDYPSYRDGLKNLREKIAKTPVNAWRHITLHHAIMAANNETDQQKLKELKHIEIIADHSPAKNLLDRLKRTKVALIEFMNRPENKLDTASLQLQHILNKIDYFYAKLINDPAQLNNIIKEMSGYISNLALEIDQNEDDKLSEIIILLKDNLENLGSIRNVELHWLDAVFAANALYSKHEDAQTRKEIKKLCNFDQYANIDLRKEAHNQFNFSYVQDSLVLIKKLIIDLKLIQANSLPNLAQGSDQISKAIYTIQGLRKKFIFKNKNKSLAELEPTLKFFHKIEDSLQTLVKPINFNLYFEINKENGDSPLAKLNSYFNQQEANLSKDKSVQQLLALNNIKLNGQIKNLVSRMPKLVQTQANISDRSPLQNMSMLTKFVYQQPSLIEFWKTGWFDWNFSFMFEKNKLKKEMKILLLDAKINASISHFCEGKFSPPEFIIDTEWYMNQKSRLQGREQTRQLKDFLTSVKQLYATHMFNANSTLADRAKTFGSDAVILNALGTYSPKLNKAKEIQATIIEQTAPVLNKPVEKSVKIHQQEVETELELYRHLRHRGGLISR